MTHCTGSFSKSARKTTIANTIFEGEMSLFLLTHFSVTTGLAVSLQNQRWKYIIGQKSVFAVLLIPYIVYMKQFNCKVCGKAIGCPEHFRGIIGCPHCGAEDVEGPSARLACPGCGRHIPIRRAEGTIWKCPSCQRETIYTKGQLRRRTGSLFLPALIAAFVVTITLVILTDITFFVFSFPVLFLLHLFLFQFIGYLLSKTDKITPNSITGEVLEQSNEETNIHVFPELVALTLYIADTDFAQVQNVVRTINPNFDPTPFTGLPISRDSVKTDIETLKSLPAPLQLDLIRALSQSTTDKTKRAFLVRTARYLGLKDNFRL